MGKALTVVDVIESALGERLTEHLILKPQKIDAEVQQRIARAYREYERTSFQIPTHSPGEVFPYVHPSWTTGSQLGSFRAELAAEGDVDSTERNIKKVLLYYHRIAIPDGFSYLCDYTVLPLDQTVVFLNYLRLFARLRKLIKREVILFTPEIPTYFPAREAVNKIRGAHGWREQVEAAFGPGPHGIVQEIIEQSLWIGAEFDLDLFLPSAKAVDFFDKYSQILGKAPLQEGRRLEAVGANLLLMCTLPAIDRLSIEDLVQVREGGDAFAAWRASLRRVLETSYRDLQKDAFTPEELLRLATEEFAGARKAIDNEVSKSSSLGLAKSGLRSVGIGLMTGLATAAALTDPLAVMGSLAASASSTFLWDYLGGLRHRNARKQKKALKAHYAVWSSPSSRESENRITLMRPPVVKE